MREGGRPASTVGYHGDMTLVAFSLLQTVFVGLLVLLVGIVGLFFLFLAAQLIRNPGRRPRTRT